MSLSHAEATYEYTQEEIKRLKDEIEKAKLVIEHNDERIKYLENKVNITAKRLVEEHPTSDQGKKTDVQSEAERKSLKQPIMKSNSIDGTKTTTQKKRGAASKTWRR